MNFSDLLRARATKVIPGADYNNHRQEARDRAVEADEFEPLYLEALLPAEAPQQALDQQVMPTFTRFLDGKKRTPERPRGVVVALFLGEQCYLLEGQELVALYCALEGLDQVALRERMQRFRL